MNDENVTMRGFKRGDEEGIVDLFNDVFNATRTLDRWRWQFAGHVQGEGWITLADAGGEIVGQYCMMRNHLNFRGTEIRAGQSCDTMIQSGHRRKRWFVRLAETNYAFAVGTGLQAVFGFPNRFSYHGLIRDLSWHRITNLTRYHRRIGCRKLLGPFFDAIFKRLLRSILKRRAAVEERLLDGMVVRTTDTLPAEVEELLAEIRSHETLSVWKDLRYLKWRFEKHPDVRYTFYIAYRHGRAEGLVITKSRGGRVAVCDVLHRTKNVPETASLIYQVMLRGLDSGAQAIDFFGHDAGFFGAVFDRCGFRAKRSDSYVFCGRVFGNRVLEEQFYEPRSWTVAYGDVDIA
jgi:hypothetical protein